ncbi:MAG TPA: YebC/PmpR family DNA-binding transcriptional regulator [Pirellulaceae bacterium]|nr:YebC/PmpR family DNA-binding transcriptional regulator [Pirellulaceae bacterium]
MAGHSHWAGIKHKKAVVDAKRGKLWTKLSKAIIVAARLGGGDPAANARLRTAIADAKAVSMPKDNIERAIKRGTGELDGANVEEILYEGYAPHGVAVLCEVMTDNRNRTAPELRKLFENHGGNLGATGCVSYLFDRRGLFLIPTSAVSEEKLFEIVGEVGAEDIKLAGAQYEVLTPPELFSAVADALESAGITCDSKQVTRIPQNTVELDVEQTRAALAFLEALDDHDDVQNVSSNLNIPDEIMANLS